MATNRPADRGGERPEDPTDLLPEDSVLSLDDYLAMHAAVGHRTRYEIVYRLVHGDGASPTELEEQLEIDDSTLHYHLETLLDAGLVEKRVETERDDDGLYSYYRATVFGTVTLTDGVDELIRGEWEFEEMYDGSA